MCCALRLYLPLFGRVCGGLSVHVGVCARTFICELFFVLVWLSVRSVSVFCLTGVGRNPRSLCVHCPNLTLAPVHVVASMQPVYDMEYLALLLLCNWFCVCISFLRSPQRHQRNNTSSYLQWQ